MRPPAAKSVTLMASGYALGLLLGGGHRGPVVDTLCVLVAAVLVAAALWCAWCEWRPATSRSVGVAARFAWGPEEDTARFSDGPDAPTSRELPVVCSGPCTVANIYSGAPRLVCKRQPDEAMCDRCPSGGIRVC